MANKKQEVKPLNQRALPKGLAKALIERKAGVDSEALLNDLVEVWGGPRQLAIDIHDEYQKAPPGGMVRQRIMEMLQRLVMNNTMHDLTKVIKPSDMTKEELEAVAMRYVKRLSEAPTNGDTSTASG